MLPDRVHIWSESLIFVLKWSQNLQILRKSTMLTTMAGWMRQTSILHVQWILLRSLISYHESTHLKECAVCIYMLGDAVILSGLAIEKVLLQCLYSQSESVLLGRNCHQNDFWIQAELWGGLFHQSIFLLRAQQRISMKLITGRLHTTWKRSPLNGVWEYRTPRTFLLTYNKSVRMRHHFQAVTLCSLQLSLSFCHWRATFRFDYTPSIEIGLLTRVQCLSEILDLKLDIIFSSLTHAFVLFLL